jgi:hypothetical protein
MWSSATAATRRPARTPRTCSSVPPPTTPATTAPAATGPAALTDLRGTAGRAIAIRKAILAARAHGPAATEAAITAAITAGDSYADQPSLFDHEPT